MIRVLIAHQSRLVSDSLRTALDKESDVHVVGCAYTAEELQFLQSHATIVLLDSEMNGSNSCALIEKIRSEDSNTRVLVLGVSEAPEEIIRFIEAGAAGYILQNESIDDVVVKLQAAHERKAIISPSMAAAMMERLAMLVNSDTALLVNQSQISQLNELTAREEEVVELITQGCTNKEIADRLIIECGTVKNHVHNILKKLEVNSRYEAASLYRMQQPAAMATA